LNLVTYTLAWGNRNEDMTKKIGRNAPCPCGSGKKYKVCCIHQPKPAITEKKVTPQFRFEAGSYGGNGHFVPSIGCFKQLPPDEIPNERSYHFVLVKPAEQYDKEDDASEKAEADLENAFLRKESTGSDFAVAEYLKSHGYSIVSDFRVARDEGETGRQNMIKNQSADIIGYSAYDPVEGCYEYNENECYVADSPESLQKFLASAPFPIENYRIDEVTISDFVRDYGCSYGSYALEPEALERFERLAGEHRFDYDVEEYEDYFDDIEPKIFIVNFKQRQNSGDEI